VIESPQYPIQYTGDADCTYEIEALPNHDIILTILNIDMPARADCTGDSLTLSKVEDDMSVTMLTVFCGTETFPKYTVIRPKSVLIHFKSDSRRGGTFKLRYTQEPSTLEDSES